MAQGAGQRQRCAPSTSSSTGPQVLPPTPESGLLKREAISPIQPSNHLKHRRTEDSSHQPHMQPDVIIVEPNHPINNVNVVRQVSRLSASFQSFNDVSLRQVESRGEHDKQKTAFEESQRIFEQNKRAYEESERVYISGYEWLASRSNSAGESLSEGATALLSSIPHDRASLAHIAPELERFRLIFAEFERAQRQLSTSNKFTGSRAQALFDLNECIRRIAK